MTTVTQQIEQIRKKHRETKLAEFKHWLKRELGRLPKKGDLITLKDGRLYERICILRVVEIGWDYSNAAVFCNKQDEAGRLEEGDELGYARNMLKSAHFSRPDERDGSAFELMVTINVDRDRDFPKTDTHVFPTFRKAHRFVEKFCKEKWTGRHSFDWEPVAGESPDAFFMLYTKAGNNQKGSISIERVRKTLP